jgi:hypothetical protein
MEHLARVLPERAMPPLAPKVREPLLVEVDPEGGSPSPGMP